MTHILIADPDPRIRQALVLLLERRLDAIQASEAWIAPRSNANWRRGGPTRCCWTAICPAWPLPTSLPCGGVRWMPAWP